MHMIINFFLYNENKWQTRQLTYHSVLFSTITFMLAVTIQTSLCDYNPWD